MPDDQEVPFKLFSASSAHELLAECPHCGKVLKVPKRTANEADGRLHVPGGVLCPCGHRHEQIDVPPPAPKVQGKEPSMAETILAQALVWGVLGVVLIGGGYLLLSMIRGGSGGDSGSAPAPNLTAVVRVSGGQVQVVNEDSFDWTDCKVTLNAGIGGSWSQDYGVVASGTTARGGLMAFTRARGERFNPLTHAVQDVLVDCSTPGGRSYWSGRFR